MVSYRSAYDKPFWVVSGAYRPDLGRVGFCQGFEDQAEATADAEERTARAKAMGVEASYSALPRPTGAK